MGLQCVGVQLKGAACLHSTYKGFPERVSWKGGSLENEFLGKGAGEVDVWKKVFRCYTWWIDHMFAAALKTDVYLQKKQDTWHIFKHRQQHLQDSLSCALRLLLS